MKVPTLKIDHSVMWLQQDMSVSPPKQKIITGHITRVKGEVIEVMCDDNPCYDVSRRSLVHKDYLMAYSWQLKEELQKELEDVRT